MKIFLTLKIPGDYWITLRVFDLVDTVERTFVVTVPPMTYDKK